MINCRLCPYSEDPVTKVVRKKNKPKTPAEARMAKKRLPKIFHPFLCLEDTEPVAITKDTIIHVDMDDTICQLKKAVAEARGQDKDTQYPQSVPGFFENLDPIPGAIEAVYQLHSKANVYILTAPSVRNPSSYTEKRLWIEKHFDIDLCHRLIICMNKGLVKGDILIDDYRAGRGQEFFEGLLFHFGSELYPDWEAVLKDINLTGNREL